MCANVVEVLALVIVCFLGAEGVRVVAKELAYRVLAVKVKGADVRLCVRVHGLVSVVKGGCCELGLNPVYAGLVEVLRVFYGALVVRRVSERIHTV